MKLLFRNLFAVLTIMILFSACEDVTPPSSHIDGDAIQFSGEVALDMETDFVKRFPNRSSGMPNNRRAVDWLFTKFRSMGMYCQTDSWNIINYNRHVKLENLICTLPGESQQEIIIVAHHDQSPSTIQGADNDGSGIAILLQLAKIFSRESSQKYTLVFVASDGEEYGMLGTKRFMERHPNHRNIIAGISLDNLGKRYYDGIRMSAIGQFEGYGPLWLQQLAQESSKQGEAEWIPAMKSVIEQILDQAVPVSFMDQGPMVSAGIPAVGFAGTYPAEYSDAVWDTYHSERDSVIYQSAHSLEQSGRVAEATIRGLMSLDEFPKQNLPYVYRESDFKILQGWPLKLILLCAILPFFVIAGIRFRRIKERTTQLWKNACLSFLAMWIPLIASIMELYLFVKIGLMDEYHLYPATSKDPAIYSPKWMAVILFLVTLAALIWLGNRFARKFTNPSSENHLSVVSFLVIGIGSVVIFLKNPFSVILILPLYIWGLIHHRSSFRWMNIVWFLLGGAMIYALIGYFGFVIMQNDFAILWYLMMMFSCGMIGFPTAVIITGLLASGIILVKEDEVRKTLL